MYAVYTNWRFRFASEFGDLDHVCISMVGNFVYTKVERGAGFLDFQSNKWIQTCKKSEKQVSVNCSIQFQ